MAKKHAKILDLDSKTCRLGKISNNLEKHGGDWITGFTIPVTGLMLTRAELNAFMRDKFCHQSWFDTSKPGAPEPMAWWGGESFYVSESFEADKATITVSGGTELDFESTGDPKEEDYRAGIVVEKIILTPQTGGMTELTCSIYVLPGIGKKNLALQDHQHREVKITLVDGRVLERKKRQPELPMGQPAEGGGTPPAPADGGGEAAATH